MADALKLALNPQLENPFSKIVELISLGIDCIWSKSRLSRPSTRHRLTCILLTNPTCTALRLRWLSLATWTSWSCSFLCSTLLPRAGILFFRYSSLIVLLHADCPALACFLVFFLMFSCTCMLVHLLALTCTGKDWDQLDVPNWQLTSSPACDVWSRHSYVAVPRIIMNSLWHRSNNFCQEVLCPEGGKSQLWKIFWVSVLWNNHNVSSTC